MRALIVLAAALCVTASPASAGVQNPPKMPNSTKGQKRCKAVKRYGYRFRVYVTHGRVSCKTARHVVRKGVNTRRWTYFDWTKGGNGPWSDVWTRKHNRKRIGAIINA